MTEMGDLPPGGPSWIYDTGSDYWTNYENGPRRLTEKERRDSENLKSDIDELKKSGADISVELFGKRSDSVVGIPAGVAANSKWINFYSQAGYDILTLKTVRDSYWEGWPLPNVINVSGDFAGGFSFSKDFTGTITNTFGIGSPDPEKWVEDVKENIIKNLPKGKVFKISVIPHPKHKTREDFVGQFANLSAIVKETGADCVEYDLSCPNLSSSEGDVYADPKLTREIVESARTVVGKYPILIKVGYLDNFGHLTEAVGNIVDGIVAINAMPAVVKDGGGPMFPERGGKAGVCGEALREMGLNAVGQLHSLRQKSGYKYSLTGVGGISGQNDAIRYLDAGADAIEIGTAAMLNPLLALSIKKALMERCEK
ncbi:MAG: hypothetical protein HYS53_01105 [Candidatus Aenigmarchaeota archaeon]|nr:hypothetical protein [Candidatus Aenigmarchaeota archaeon]